MEELPDAIQLRLQRNGGLSAYDASLLTSDWNIANYFEGVRRNSLLSGESWGQSDYKLCANWVINEVMAERNRDGDLENLPSWKRFGVSDETLGHLLRLIRQELISAKTAKELFSELWEESRNSGYEHHGGHPQHIDELIKSRSLQQLNDSGAIEAIIDEVLAANQKSVEEFRAGKEKAFNALVGQAMKATKGKANPQQVNDLLRKKLS